MRPALSPAGSWPGSGRSISARANAGNEAAPRISGLMHMGRFDHGLVPFADVVLDQHVPRLAVEHREIARGLQGLVPRSELAELALALVNEYPTPVEGHNAQIEHYALLPQDRLISPNIDGSRHVR